VITGHKGAGHFIARGSDLNGPVVPVAGPDVPHPHNAILMEAVTVNQDDIVAGIKKAVGRE
jgi:pyruvate/2-oxoglutarate/acetoin dehydrogenase E1 component